MLQFKMWLRAIWLVWILGAMGSVGLGCTRVPLKAPPEHPPETATVNGQICNLDPMDLPYPVKVMFVLDSSCSMKSADPAFLRKQALNAVADEYLADQDEDFHFGLSIFDDGWQLLTPPDEPFTQDIDLFKGAVGSIPKPDGATNYEAALSHTYKTIQQDIYDNPKDSARATYVVQFMSDGAPNPDLGTARYTALAEQIKSLEYTAAPNGCLRATVNTAMLDQGGYQANLEALLQAIAASGGGNYQRFTSGSEIDFSDIDLSYSRRNYKYWNMIISNLNVLPTEHGVAVDSDADGLSDAFEEEIGSNPMRRDTDGDGCSDTVEHNLGWPVSTPPHPKKPDHCYCDTADRYTDSDGDGLSNCEERFTLTGALDPDSDVDGMIDSTELFFGLRPNLDDVNRDEDLDFVTNGEEVRRHRTPIEIDTEAHDEFSYEYPTFEVTEMAGRTCYEFEVENVGVLPTLSSGPQHNTIEIVWAQTPSDQPGAEVIYSRATIDVEIEGEPGTNEVRFVNSSEIEFKPEDFEFLGVYAEALGDQ